MITWLILLTLVGIGILIVGSVLPIDSGYVLINIAHYTFETSLITFLGVLIITTLIGYLGMRAIMIPIGLDWRFNAWRRRKQRTTARRQTTRGLLALAQGQWRRAERQLSSNAEHSDQPLINYLAAARAAFEQEQYDAVDQWLKAASESTKGSELAVGIAQVELLRSRQQHEQALAVLLRLRRRNNRHPYILKLLIKTYEDLQDWISIHELIPKIRRLTKIPEDKLQQLEIKVAIQLLENQRNEQPAKLRETFNSIERDTRYQYEIFRRYIDILLENGHQQLVETTIRNSASKIWHDDLTLLYGTLDIEDTEQPLLFAEQQLKSRPNDAKLLLTLARLSRRAGKDNKALEYLQMGLKISGIPELHSELASLLESQGETSTACHHYEKALSLA